jgi:uncharacterized membrane protein YeaQ/YmgE (transglycosylase-associated protein family)
MTFIGFLMLLVVAAFAGSLGQTIAGYSLGGCAASIVVGFVGAYIGMWVANQFGLNPIFSVSIQGETFPIVWSVIGSALLSATLGILLRRRATL